jgi:hypothetical protein
MCETWKSIAQEAIDRMEYKPSCQINVDYAQGVEQYEYASGEPAAYLQLDMKCDADSRDENAESFNLVRRFLIPEGAIASYYYGVEDDEKIIPLRNFVHDRIVEVEMHEIDEWFKTDGVLAFDPHKEEARV